METNLALKVIEPDSDLSRIYIGNSCFTDDIWDLRPFIPVKTVPESHKSIKFGYISSEDMKLTVKQYAYHKFGMVKPMTVHKYVNNHLPRFFEYCGIYGINSFKYFTKEDFIGYSLWLKDERKVAGNTGFHLAHVLEDIIKIGQIMGWNVPKTNIFAEITTGILWDYKKYLHINRTKPIPEDIFDKIMYHALHDEKDIIKKAGIIIQSQTGLRISEVYSICEDCVNTSIINGIVYDYMRVTLSKTEKGEPTIHKVFINELVKNVINELSEATKTLRKESGLKELFLERFTRLHGKIDVCKVSHYVILKLDPFIKRWDIRDNKGILYPLKSHQFRATFARELIKRKVPIAYIMKQYSHVSIEMTAHYLMLQEEEIREIYSDMILSPEARISGIRAKELRGKLDNLFHGKTEEELDRVISDLSKSMSFNPLPTGVCLYDFRRGNCTDGNGCFFYNCPNFITEVQFHPILKDELMLIEKEMDRLKTLGQEPAWQVQYVKWKYLKPLVEDLEVQINGKENIG